MKTAVRTGLWVFAGLVLLQAAWIITIPPFRGIDEFDHVYRAVGVAEGHWVLSETTSGGRGLVVEVPPDVVDAAQAQCAWLEYTGPDNCFPIAQQTSGSVEILTAAGKYHPLYYFVVGTAAAPFDGAAVDYAMRATSALLCAMGVAVAAGCLVLAGAGRWTSFGLLVGVSPMLAYTTALPAPNSIEVVAALLVWSSVVGLLAGSLTDRQRAGFLLLATTAAAVLATVRYLGPLWLFLIVLVCLIHSRGTGGLRRLWDQMASRLITACAVVAVVVATSMWWAWYSGLLAGSADQADVGNHVPSDTGLRPVLWMLQMVAAFPLRREVAPTSVYAAYLLVLTPLVIAGIRYAAGARRTSLMMAVIGVLVVPAALTLATIGSHGSIWQGRYTLPLAVGVPLLAGVALDKRAVAFREAPRLVSLGMAVAGAAHASALLGVRGRVDNEVARQDPAWMDPSPALLVALVVLAMVCWVRAAGGRLTTSRVVEREASRTSGRSTVVAVD